MPPKLFCSYPLRMYNPKVPPPPTLFPTHEDQVLTGEDEEGGKQRDHNDPSPGHLEIETQELYWTEQHTSLN